MNIDNPNRMDENAQYQEGYKRAVYAYGQKKTDPYVNTLGPLLWYGFPVLVTFVIGKRLLAKQMSGGLAEMFSPISSRSFRADVKKVKFADVIGIDEAKDEVMQYFKFLNNSEKFRNIGARMPKGCLLTGEPGTGKTLLAKAIAGEANVPFFSCNGADFVEVYGGSGARRVREIFREAREQMPSVIFIDEIDALGSRDSSQSGGSGEESRTLNQLLAELDGLSQSSTDKIMVFAATNIKSALDKALLREGRFDRKIQIDLPDRTARMSLFKFYLKGNMKSETSEILEKHCEDLSDLTAGFSPATIATIVNEASLNASAKGECKISKQTLLGAIEDVAVGKKKDTPSQSEESKQRAACYEAGKAIISWFLPLETQIKGEIMKVSIVTRGGNQGFNYRKGKEANEYDTDIKLFNEVCQLIAGKIAETRFFGNAVTQNAISDQNRASKLCLQGLLSFGFQKSFGRISNEFNEVGQGKLFVTYSSKRQEETEDKANSLLINATQRCNEIFDENTDKFNKVVAALIKKTELCTDDLSEILGPRQ